MTADPRRPACATMQPLARTPGYQPHVDGLRAVAVVAVMIHHLDPGLLPGGFVGVDVFFVISGYVVTASLAGHGHEKLATFLGGFYARRMARLVPALVLMLVVTTALHVLFVPQTWFNRAAETVGQMAFWGLGNWTLDRHVVNYFEPRAEWNPFTHTWSLGVEEQFYLVAPLLLFHALAAAHARKRRLAALAVLGALTLASFVACNVLGFTQGGRVVFYPLAFRFWELACGALLFLAGPWLASRGLARARWYGWAGWAGAGLIGAALLLPAPSAFPWVRAAIAVAGALLLIGLPGIARCDPLQRLLESRAALWIGVRSYSLYLWHWPVYVLARWTVGLTAWPFNALAVGLGVALAAGCYRWVENPIRHSALVQAWPAAVRIGAFAALLAAGWLCGSALHSLQPVLGLGKPTREAADWYAQHQLLKTALADRRTCEPHTQRTPLGSVAEGVTSFVPQGCASPAPQALFVIGDSHATAYMPMLEQISAEQQRAVHVMQAPGCAYLNLLEPLSPAMDKRCHDLALAARRHVLALARPGDIVFLPSLRVPRLIHLGGETRSGALPQLAGDVYARTPAERRLADLAVAQAPRWFEPFVAAGLRVVFELPKPVFSAHPFQCVDVFTRSNPVCAAGLSEPREAQDRLRAPAVDAIRHWSASYPGVSAWDPLPWLCDPDTCSALRGGRPLFFDGDHLSPYGNLVILQGFRSVVASTGAAAP